ncbi:MAG: N-acetyltransferase [Proteobacteria bacterium]|nr:N-acetyltransferase [Pseudomonadota bacterium]MBU1688710.1 N-acetyltransferase [Pseudomonadota bacterium]
MIRNAHIDDVKPIYALLQHFSDKQLLLGRSLSSLYDQLRDFVVYEENDLGAGIIGVCALHVCWENLAEIRSLAVPEEHQRKGIGSALVRVCLEEAVRMGIKRVFTLTYQPEFFNALGFRGIDKGKLPHKVWSDCIKCPKFPDCNEEAMIWE